MGIKDRIIKAGIKASDGIAKLSVLSPEQLNEIQNQRNAYLTEMPAMNDSVAEEQTNRLLSACGIEIYNEYLEHLDAMYSPIDRCAEYGVEFETAYNIRFFKITKWVTDKKENSIEKLVNVYEVLSNEDCNIALIFNRKMNKTDVYIALTNNLNSNNNKTSDVLKTRLFEAIKGNFPGSEFSCVDGKGIVPCLSNNYAYSVAAASNIPGEKSEKFISQTIEKLLDGTVPNAINKEYILILLATPVNNIEDRKLHLSNLYSALSSYSQWSTSFQYTESNSTNSTATFGVNAGVSAGVQNGVSGTVSHADGTSKQESKTLTDTKGSTKSDTETISNSKASGETNTKGEALSSGRTTTATDSTNSSQTVGVNVGVKSEHFSIGGSYSNQGGSSHSYANGTSFSNSTNSSFAKSITNTITDAAGKTIGESVSNAVANTLGKAVSKTVTTASSLSKSINTGANFGANFARSSNVSVTVGKGETINQSFTNHNIKHTLEILDAEMKRYDQSTALGMWDFAAYILSEDCNVASNVAHSYLALTQGNQSFTSKTAVNLWRGDMGENSNEAKEICNYLRELRHPLFGLKPALVHEDSTLLTYPAIATATTSLSGKELAYSLNFPKKSLTGFPVIECAEFGRSVVTYDEDICAEKIEIGNIFHMNHKENTKVKLSKNSLSSHLFVTGSTGSGKSNTIYKILDESIKEGVKFLVVEPAKGEYKHVFGGRPEVNVYGTNPKLTPLLRIDPFSFPKGIHVFEHLDRLVEIFNVCWPMYAAMPAVLKSAIEKSYEDCGWNLVKSENKYNDKLFPSFIDVARNIRKIIDSSEYDTENKGAYKGSLLTRLQSLSTGINSMIFSSNEVILENLFDQNTIVDLSRIGSTETKSLIMGMLILKLQEYRMSNNVKMNSDLKHITVLEEAHNILKKSSSTLSSESTNITGKSVEMIANAIAEMRTYGEGFIISDQAPGLMDMSVIRNTNTKIIMRLPDQTDRQLVGKAANLNDDQIIELAKLPRGVAAIYQNEWVQPVLCTIDKYDEYESTYENKEINNFELYDAYDELSEYLLKCIMNNEFLYKGEKHDLRKYKDLIIRSRLDSHVKVDFLKYIEDTSESNIESLRCLMYDFLNAEDAIKSATEISDIREWVDSVINKLHPSIEGYSKKQIDLTMALILHEQVIRDVTYRDIYHAFTEMYKKGGDVF